MTDLRPATYDTAPAGAGPIYLPARRPSRLTVLARRWPSALAVASAALVVAGDASDGSVGRLAEVLFFLPWLYLVVSTLRRPGLTWVVLVGGVALTSGLVAVTSGVQALAWVDLPVVLLASALAATVWGGAHGRLGDGSFFTVQVVGMVAFGATAALAMYVDPAASRYVVAAGWFAHGVWDFVHLRRGRVVARSYAEWCGVVDVLVAVQLVVLPLL